jgi:sulfite exporter TauE/SafE
MFGVSGLRACQLLPASGAAWGVPARLRYAGWVLLWALGHLAGGAAVGAALGALGGLVWSPAPQSVLAVFSLACLAWALREFGGLRLPMPCWQRQVQRDWMCRLPWGVVALGYGLQLGSGVLTRIKTATTYAALACALLTGSPLWGGVVMATFGLCRALLPGLLGPWLTSPVEALHFSRTVDRYEPTVRRLNALVLLAAAVLLAAQTGESLLD